MIYNMPYVNMEKTGANLRQLIKARGYSVRQVQDYLCLGSNQAIYSWLVGRNLPTVDNLVALSCLLDVTIDELLVLECPQ